MKRWKQTLLAGLAALLLCALLPAALAAGDGGAVLRAEAGGAPRGGTAEVEIWLDNGVGIGGGSLDITYDNTALELEKVIPAALGGALVQVNEYYTDTSARLSFASSQALGEEQILLCTAVFRIKETAPLGGSAVTLENARLYDVTGGLQESGVADGAVEIQYAGLTVSSVEAVRGQSVRVELLLDGALRPAGGSFEVIYDPEQLTAGGAVAGELLDGCSLVSNGTEPGRLRVTWAGSEALKAGGVLCTVTFHVSQEASGTPEIGLENLRLYDETAAPLDALAAGGTITLLTPTEESPKLWIVGGGIDPDTCTASVDVVLEGRGVICGGGFTVDYPEGVTLLSAQSLADFGEVNTKETGNIVFAWAGEAASVESQRLLHLEFQVSDANISFPLTLEEARALDGGGNPATVVDIRSGKLLPGGLKYQAPAVDELAVRDVNGGTEIDLVLDMASASQVPSLLAQPERSLLLALYENGVLKAVMFQEFAVELDANGIAQVSVSATLQGSGDELRIFLVGEGAALVPLSEQAAYELEVAGV